MQALEAALAQTISKNPDVFAFGPIGVRPGPRPACAIVLSVSIPTSLWPQAEPATFILYLGLIGFFEQEG
jgi:hypothetical protein